jgi:O-antigen/teichoic acid export membrane protein
MTATENLSPFEEYKGYAKDIGLVAGAQIAVALLHFARLPILTKWLGASLYGTWSLIWVTVVLITPLATLGLGMAMVRFLAAEKDKAKIRERFISVLTTSLVAGAVISLILVLCSNLFATSIMGDADSSYLFRLGSIMIITQALSQISIAFFRSFRQMKWYSALTVIKAAVQLGLISGLVLLGWEVKGVILAVIASDILGIVIALSIALRQTGLQLPRFTEIKGYLKYGLPLVPTGAMLWIMASSDRYMIGYFMQSEDVGIYTAAYTLTHVMSLFLSPLRTVLLPTVSKSYDDGDIAKTKTYFKYSLKYLLMLTIPATFGLSVLASPLLRILTTAEFTSGSLVIPFVAFGLLIFEFYQICLNVFYLVKKTYWVLRLLILSAALNIGLNLLLIPHLGIVGAAVATLIAYAVLAIFTVVIAFRHFKFDLGFVFIMKSVLASAVMAGAIWLYKPWGITEVVIAILLGIIVYFAIILVLKGFSKNELSMIKELFLGFRKRNRN